MTTSSYDIQMICQQKRRRSLLNVPPPRFTPISPYPQYTKDQLDMRRKAEILKYNGNASNSKTNNFTKVEKYKQLVSGKSSFSQENLLSIANGTITCNVNTIIPTPTSSCDVPGPVISLYLDPSIPLYHYTNPTNYGVINSQDNSLWTTYTTPDVQMEQNTITELFSIYIHNSITQPRYTYTFSTPVSIYVKGQATTTNYYVNATINNVYIYVYYNSTLVVTNDPNMIGTSTSVPIITSDFISLGVKTTTTSSFSAVFYSGVLTISNIELFVQPGFIYDVKLVFGLTLTYNKNITIYSYGTYCNVSVYNNQVTGCLLTNSVSTDTNSGFVFGT